MIDPASRARLEGWKLSLLGRLRLAEGEDPLLSVSPSQHCIALVDVDPAELVASLAQSGSIVLDSDRTELARGRVRVGRPPAELARDLVAIRRTVRARGAQDGGHVLWLGLGTLVWVDCGGSTAKRSVVEDGSHAAPLWLVPVELERVDGQLRIVAATGVAACVNLALVAKLRRDFDLVLPTDVGSLPAILDLAEGIAITRPGWRVERTAYLGVFSLASAILWSDLDTLGDAVLANPLVAHLATGAERTFVQPSATAAGAVTATASESPDLLAPLDADAAQRAAVAAAAAGATFVLQGPPGTGKSQTIANLIVHAVSAGRTVLVVSGRRGALDAVQQRLAAIGLGEFCLDLGARQPGAIVAQLGRILERAFRPGSNLGADSRLAELRAALDAHVEALHRVGPFGHSLHDVIGRLVELRTTPRAWLADPDAVGLDASKLARRKAAVAALAQASIAVEPAGSHPWRHSRLVVADEGLRDRALAALDEAAAAGGALAGAVRDVASLVPGLVARTRDQLVALGALAAIAAASPRPGAELLTSLRTGRRHEADILDEQIALVRARGSGAIEPPRDPQAFLALATRHRGLAREVASWFTDAVDELDAQEAWSQLRKWTESVGPVRFVALRAVRTQVKAAAQLAELATDEAMISALEAVIAERACRTALLAAAAPAARWFGDLGGDPLALDLDRIEAAVGWGAELRRAFDSVDVGGGEGGRASAWRALVAQVCAGASDGSERCAFARLAETVARWEPALAVLATVTGIEPLALGSGEDHLATLREQLETWRHAIDGLVPWVTFHAARAAASVAGVGPAIAAIERGDLAAAELAASWERATLLAWVEAELADHPVLAQFHGAQHHAHVAAFADFDRANLALERSRALARLAERVPRIGRDKASRAPISDELVAEIAILKAALKDPAREPSGPVDADATTRTSLANATLRELFAAIPTLLPRLAPCMLMTPQDVAQYLPPCAATGDSEFDIVVFDEAERLSTAAALGALARGASAVVVGDSHLLAEPSNLLDECIHARVPVLALAWHYQSKHEELVAFANERYYDGRMQVFPAAAPSSELGVLWRRVEGTFEPALGENRAEAEAIVADVLARLREPAQRARSIGIVTFTEGQQALIEDLLDEARAADPALEPLLDPSLAGRDRAAASGDPIVVKTADAMQGEVRDVIYVSVAARPAIDATAAELGPLWQPGGERRLAVAITRAREQLILVTSFGVEDVNPDAAPAGLVDLAALLGQTRTGGRPTDRTEMLPASPITSAIARALADRGWTVRHQVGVGAYRIDLAVVDPNDPDRYVLGIEHDGAAYASAPTARDRDRIRPQILAGLGWRLHRIWSLDWWLDAERELQRAHSAIVTAVAAGRQRRTTLEPAPARTRAIRTSNSPTQPSTPVIRIPPKRTESAPVLAAGSGPAAFGSAPTSTETTAEGSRPVSWSGLRRGEILIGPYTVAAIPAGRRAPDDLFAPRHLPELGKVVEQVLAAEAPMHVELLARRVGAYFGIGRVTQRVTDQVKLALEGRARFGDEDDVVWRLDQDPAAVPAVRVAPNDLGTSTWRDIGEVPLCELAAAVRIVVERAPNIGTASLVRDTARLLGFTRVTERVTERIVVGVQSATERDLIAIENGRALLPG